MNYAVILASGKGTRMKSIDIPKQYYEIDGIPIIIYTLNSIIDSGLFDCLYVAINESYNEFVRNLINKYISDDWRDK